MSKRVTVHVERREDKRERIEIHVTKSMGKHRQWIGGNVHESILRYLGSKSVARLASGPVSG